MRFELSLDFEKGNGECEGVGQGDQNGVVNGDDNALYIFYGCGLYNQLNVTVLGVNPVGDYFWDINPFYSRSSCCGYQIRVFNADGLLQFLQMGIYSTLIGIESIIRRRSAPEGMQEFFLSFPKLSQSQQIERHKSQATLNDNADYEKASEREELNKERG
ncbi:MAG: hypothetical protein EZS28_012196 [Streblomastix strix]|uniref:Uncharacterized protein n=1 Tax=Streblomastix strix TaxID=222440 RepID=A0A5J4WBE9_9EUKA|nr:MAG: hypothetical protein EZS28_012196 [Streblomastix strix]